APDRRDSRRHASAAWRGSDDVLLRHDGQFGELSRGGSRQELIMDLQTVWLVMKWPLAASLLLPPLLVYLGLHVVKREVIFVDLALAQVATLGTCVGLILGYQFNDRITFWLSLGVTFLAAGLFSWSRSSEKRHVPQE